jgi:hypothetical protein
MSNKLTLTLLPHRNYGFMTYTGVAWILRYYSINLNIVTLTK